MDLIQIYHIFQLKYNSLKDIKLKIIKYNNKLTYEGICVYDTLGYFTNVSKSQQYNIKYY